jgi:hypothetical protein
MKRAAAAAGEKPPRILIIHSANEDTGQEEDTHCKLPLEKLTEKERLLAEFSKVPGEWAWPTYDRGANAPMALGSYLAAKYKCQWKKGDPLDESRIEEESDKGVVRFLKSRLKQRRAKYHIVIQSQWIGESDDTLVEEQLDEYVEHLQELLGQAECEYYGRLAAQEWAKANPEKAKTILALDTERDFVWSEKEQEAKEENTPKEDDDEEEA